MSKIKTKLNKLIKNRTKVPDEFWVDGAIWFHEAETSSGGYDWSSERLGIKFDGNVVWAFDSGCSCNSPWESFDINSCESVSHKEFVIENFLGDSKDRDYSDDEPKGTEEKAIEKGIDEFLLLVREDVKPEEVLTATNAEIRRYLIKRIGYEKIKDAVKATVIHKDGDSELLVFENKEMYVKVKDSSTDREYLLFVEGNHKTCKSAIAWTFGLQEHEYNPIIET